MTNRVFWIDFIKVFAMFTVVFLHIAAPVVAKIGEIDFSHWMIGNVFDSMVRMGVPLFFMVTGVLLLNNKKESLSVFFKKRFIKVVIPLLAWSFVYILFRKYGGHEDINIFSHMVYSLNSPQYEHLWFLYTIIGIYLLLPILKVFTQNAAQSIQVYFIILWIISVSILPFINYFTGLSIKSYMPMMAGLIGYLVLGYQLSKIKITTKLFTISIFFIIFSTLGTIYGTYYLSEKANKYIDFFYSYLSITTMIQAIAYFIFLKYIGETLLVRNTKTTEKVITTMSITSLGIYLIHPIYISILKKLGISVFAFNPLIMIPVVAILTFILSFITIMVLQKTRIGKIITP
ncbi:MAG: acyltransferase family protein [Sulfurovum sp.]|nr:acyltransferase family protein [Sulfurovum sp.]